MGIGSLLGILDGLGDLLGKLFSGLFTFLVQKLLVPIFSAAIEIIFTVLQYFGAALFYEISKFLLGLIDFVEVLFRALAGLPSTAAAGHEITMSINGKSGDLLIQMLTSSEVMQAFYATAIVGMFLLIITTIFQMIKVEYTTEGAQNSKSGIIGKSLKSLCNMMIIPILCILGVFIGNQVLDLIDTATGGGEGSKISGTLWVAAASSAMVEKNSFVEATEIADLLDGLVENNTGGLMGLGIELAIGRGFQKGISQMLGIDWEVKPLGTPISASARDATENDYLKGTNGKSYYNLASVVVDYNPFEVNYLVLIFGACIIIKCLYYTCFGLIDRLYQCVALFIVMPMVVGMSPVKDSLGSWRSKFMSKALSAYGTVISLNLFFIIVKIMLNIKIDFGSYYNSNGMINGSSGWPFTSSFMEGLIKSIMVIVGCLMIEKLAGDLGGYFGGGNAMSDGKGLSNDATAGIKKAASVGIGVATMGAGMAMKAGAAIGKGVGGIADKVSQKSHAKKADNANRALNMRMDWSGVTDAQLGDYGAAKDLVKENEDLIKSSDLAIANADSDIQAGAKILSSDTATREQKAAAQKQIDDAKARKTSAESQKSIAERDKTEAEGMVKDMEKDNKDLSDTYKLQQQADAANSVVAKDNEKNQKKAEDKAGAKLARKEKFTTTTEGLKQLYNNKFGTQALFNNVAPKSLQNLQKDYQSAVKDGNATPEGQAMLADLENRRKKEAEEAYNRGHRRTIEFKNSQQLNLALQAVNAKLVYANQETSRDLQKLNTTLNDLIDKMNKAKDQSTKDIYANQISAVQQNMQAKNSLIKFGNDLKVENETALTVDFRMDSNFMKKLQDEVKKGVKMDDIMAQINDEFKRIGLNDKDTLAKIYKALEELKSQFGGK